MAQGLAPIHKTVIVSEADESIGVGRRRRSEPATVDMNVGGCTLRHASVDYLDTVLRYAHRAISALGYANVFVCAHICNIKHNVNFIIPLFNSLAPTPQTPLSTL